MFKLNFKKVFAFLFAFILCFSVVDIHADDGGYTIDDYTVNAIYHSNNTIDVKEVIDVNFQSARPPEQVKDAFDDAIKAQEDEQRFIRQAEAYAREAEPIARGDAQRIVEQATAYKEQVVLDAQGEVERIQRLLPAFKLAPELLKERLYIQTMEKVMANTPKVMLDGNNGNNLTVLPLEQILRNNKPSTEQPQVNTPAAPNLTNSTSAVNSRPVFSTENNNGATQQSGEVRKGRFN